MSAGDPTARVLAEGASLGGSQHASGSYDGDGSTTGREIDVGFNPDWVHLKHQGSATVWEMYRQDTGMSVRVEGGTLSTNVANDGDVHVSSNGFTVGDGSDSGNQSGESYSYIAVKA